MRDFVLLYVNGRRHEVRGPAVFQPLTEFLRTALRLTGTKVVCAEGDCGSCSVLIGRPRAGLLEYRPITACIQTVAQLDAAHVITVEGLRYDGRLNPVQEALVAHHGAQCGFCTPGIVVALCGLLDETPAASREDVCRGLVGNLCRCTGYDSILQSAANVDRAALRNFHELYPSGQILRELEQAAKESVEVVCGKQRLLKPATLVEAVQWRASVPEAVVLAGGTDLGVLWNKGQREIGTLLCMSELPELQSCAVRGGTWVLGAATTIADVERSAQQVLPAYAELLDRFGSPPIKNAGTLGGNLANGSPIGDTMPGLFVLNAEVELIGPAGVRRVNMNDFYTGYRQTVLQSDELICRVLTPLPGRDERFAALKVTKRKGLDISAITAAVWMHVEGEIIRAARIAYGGMAAIIRRRERAEAWLVGRPLNAATLREAGRIAAEDLQPISDVRGSAEYRRLLAENILCKVGRAFLPVVA